MRRTIMREPNIKGLVQSLICEDYIEKIFENNRNAEMEISQFMYFMQKEQVNTLYHEISGLSAIEKENFFASLVRLYPLSKNFIFHLLIKRELSPIGFLDIYDIDKKLLQQIKSDLETIRSESGRSNMNYNEYMKELDAANKEVIQLETEIENVRSISRELSEKIKKKEKLERELESLREECTPENLESEIERLTKEVAKKRQERKAKIEEIEKLKTSLEKVENLGTEYTTALKGLEKCFKSIPEV